MRRLVTRATMAVALATGAAGVPLSPSQAAGTLTITSAVVDHVVTQAEPTANLTVDTDHVGHFAVDYHLDPDGGAPSATVFHAEGETDGAGVFTIPLTTTGLADGAYAVNGTVTVTDGGGDAAAGLDASGNVPLVIDRVGPVVTSIDPYTRVVRPGHSGSNFSTTLRAYGDAQYGEGWKIFGPDGTDIGSGGGYVSEGDLWYLWWPGRDGHGHMVPSGIYTFKLYDSRGNLTDTGVRVRVEHLVLRTFVKTVTAARSKAVSSVGACSALKAPSSRGWVNSLGLNSNTKCHRTARASVVLTGHAVSIPSNNVENYIDLRIAAYGGGARSRPSSVGYLMCLRKDGDMRDVSTLGSRLGSHSGPLLKAPNKVLRDSDSSPPYVAWYTWVNRSNRYDLKTFTVTLRYRVWQ